MPAGALQMPPGGMRSILWEKSLATAMNAPWRDGMSSLLSVPQLQGCILSLDRIMEYPSLVVSAAAAAVTLAAESLEPCKKPSSQNVYQAA